MSADRTGINGRAADAPEASGRAGSPPAGASATENGHSGGRLGNLDGGFRRLGSGGPPPPKSPLSLAQTYAGKEFVVVGGTGFLGKVFWSMLLDRFPGVGHIYLLVRPKRSMTAADRFWSEIATSELLSPLRDRHGSGFEAFLKEKVTPVPGDIAQLCCGLPPELRQRLLGRIAAVINAAGVVEFDPPLDKALEVNAFGVQNLVSLARDLGDCPVFHTSTCFVAGDKTGFVEEQNPLDHPFPRAGELERAHWNAEREISECLDVIRQAKHRADDAFRQSHFLDQAKQQLQARGAPPYGRVLGEEIERVRRKYVEARLAEMGRERAQFWGWANTYTYTKSLGEQIVASCGLPFTIGRPAIIESTVSFPFAGWNEGINTSAPLIYALRAGQPQLPGSDNTLDLIPCDMVAGGMLMSIAELVEGTAPPVYQYGSSDTNPVTMARIFELSGLYKRRYYQKTKRGGAVRSFLQAHYEGSLLSSESFERIGPSAFAKASRTLGDLAGVLSAGPVKSLLRPVAEGLHGFARRQEKVGNVLSQFAPFTAEYDYTFRCDNTRAAYERLSEAERAAVLWAPESIEWRSWFLQVHVPALEKWVFPELDQKMKKKLEAPPRHETIVSLLDDLAGRMDLAVALQLATPQGMERTTYRQMRQTALIAAERLRALGVGDGDRVAVAAHNHPSWAIAFFAIVYAGATVVPIDTATDATACGSVLAASQAKVFVCDEAAAQRLAGAGGRAKVCDLHQLCAEGQSELPRAALPGRAVEPSDLAALIYTSGTTAKPKGVMLSHYNLTSLIASLAPLFPLRHEDRLLSVLPLHHTFELTCGLLLPLSLGARVVYLDEVNRDRLVAGLNEGNITAMVGVPALWESLERQVYSRIEQRGPIAGKAFEFALTISRALGDKLGLDAGRLLFGTVHSSLGGHLRLLVSGGAALPESTHRLFAGLGLHLAEGYGLTEASPVVSVAKAGPGAPAGNVGSPIPGVEVKIDEPDGEGVGEVFVRGPNVMVGYVDDEAATAQALDAEGWLRTGDLGRLDRRGRLSIVGREKDVVVPPSGENVYPDDVEARLGTLPGVEEYAVLGVSGEHGKEVVALVAVAKADSSAAQSPQQLRHSLTEACQALPQHMRPAVIRVLSAPLPRTSTRKVKRPDVRRLVERALQAERTDRANRGAGVGDPVHQAVIATVASICRRKPHELKPEQSMRGELAFDSLMALELLVSLETQLNVGVDAERLSECHTLGEVLQLVRHAGARSGAAAPSGSSVQDVEKPPVIVPEPIQRLAKRWMGELQLRFYQQVMQTEVMGRAFIPANRNVLVIANHSSHLDMGLVKYALGAYGRDMVSLAAQDYFFEGGRYRRAYFENFTNLAPVSRKGSLRQSIRQAGEHLEEGRVVLLFPEGTRSTDGQLAELKPLAAHLSLQYGIDVLPVWLEGAYAALPKGASAPRSRKLGVRIGPPLSVGEMRRLTKDLSQVEKTRVATGLMHRALSELSSGRSLRLEALTAEEVAPLGAARRLKKGEDSLSSVFSELEGRFVRGSVKAPVTYYFSLGSERWTVKVTEDECSVQPGKGVDLADCVLKTSPKIFTRIVRDAYSPSPGEFLSGQVKSNNIPLLMTFQKAFQLVPQER